MNLASHGSKNLLLMYEKSKTNKLLEITPAQPSNPPTNTNQQIRKPQRGLKV